MRQLSFLSTVVFIGLTVTILTEPSFGREPVSGVIRLVENENTFRRPVIHRKRETPVIRSGVKTGRSGYLNNRRLKRRRLARSGDQNISENTVYHAAYPDTNNRYTSSVTEPEYGRFVSRAAHWQEENVRPQQARQARRIKSPQRNTDNSIERRIKDNDIGVMIRYVQPRFNGDNSAAYYNDEDMEDVVPHTHAWPTYDGPQYYCPYCRHAQSVRQYRHNDQEPDHYYPYHRFASNTHAQPELETTLLGSPHKPVALEYQTAGNLPSGYKYIGTQTEPRPDLQNVYEEETIIVPAEQKVKGIVTTETEEEQERNNNTDAKGEGMKLIGLLRGYGGSEEKIGEVADLSMEEEVTDTEDCVDDEVSAEINKPNSTPAFPLRPALTNEE